MNIKKFLWIFIFIILSFLVIDFISKRHITAVFKDIRPFEGKIIVYYKGIPIGKVTDKAHSHDCLRTNVKIAINNKKLKLPLNTKAILKKRIKNDKEIDYIELIYPEVPSEKFIKEFSHIHGYSTVDIKEYLKNQAPEDLDKVKSNILDASENLSVSLDAIGGMFVLIQDILEENRCNIKKSSENLNKTAENINKLTGKINNIIVEEQWNKTFNNIENSTGGLNNFTHNINNTVTKFDKNIPQTLQNTEEITTNLNAITCGIRKALSKKFGGLRLFFGKVIDE